MRTFASVVMFIFLIPYSASVYKGLASVCKVVLDIPEMTCMIIIAVVAALLLVFGGYMAQVRADFVQGIIMMFGVALMIFFVIRCDTVGGVKGHCRICAKRRSALSFGLSMGVSHGHRAHDKLRNLGLPQMVQKYFGIRTTPRLKKAS